MKRFQPKTSGEIKVKPGRRTFWLSRPSTLSVRLTLASLVLVGVGLVAAGVPVVPIVWYSLKPAITSRLANQLSQPVATDIGGERVIDDWLPEKNPALPEGGYVQIPAIGVNTAIIEAESSEYEQALRQGVWRVPEFGTPLKRQKPMILVAHRFGYLAWTNQYRRLNSFFNLPKLETGDRVFIAWGQREFTYEIYGADEGVEISDYGADLIVYTCQFLESPVRIFRYARLVKE